MSCERLSLLTKVTLCPAAIVTEEGEIAPLAIVIVAPLGPGLPLGGVGEPGELLLPPHATAVARKPATPTCLVVARMSIVLLPLFQALVERTADAGLRTSTTDQKNFRAMLKPMNQSS
jgi:hypothetical protein